MGKDIDRNNINFTSTRALFARRLK